MKTFSLALLAATSAAVMWNGEKLDDAVYSTVWSKETFNKQATGSTLTANWGYVELKQADKSAYVLAMMLQAGGVDIQPGSTVSVWANFADPSNPGVEEAWGCQATYIKPKPFWEGGLAVTQPIDGMHNERVFNSCCNEEQKMVTADKGAINWVADTNDVYDSYASSYMYPAGDYRPRTQEELDAAKKAAEEEAKKQEEARKKAKEEADKKAAEEKEKEKDEKKDDKKDDDKKDDDKKDDKKEKKEEKVEIVYPVANSF